MSQPETGSPSSLFLLSSAAYNPDSYGLFEEGRAEAVRQGEILHSHIRNTPVIILSSMRRWSIQTATLVARKSPTFIYDPDSNQRDYLDPEEYARGISDIRQGLWNTWSTLSACGLRKLLLVMHPHDMHKLAGVVSGAGLSSSPEIRPARLWLAEPGRVVRLGMNGQEWPVT